MYWEYWVRGEDYFALAHGAKLQKLAKELGGVKPREDPLSRYTWVNPKPFIPRRPIRYGG